MKIYHVHKFLNGLRGGFVMALNGGERVKIDQEFSLLYKRNYWNQKICIGCKCFPIRLLIPNRCQDMQLVELQPLIWINGKSELGVCASCTLPDECELARVHGCQDIIKTSRKDWNFLKLIVTGHGAFKMILNLSVNVPNSNLIKL